MPIKDLILPESNVAVEMEDEFEACLDKALNILSEQGFTRELRQEQKCSVKQLFLLSSPLFLFFCSRPNFRAAKTSKFATETLATQATIQPSSTRLIKQNFCFTLPPM